MRRRRPSELLNINNTVMSGVISGTPTYVPHMEDPRFDSMHFMMYNFIRGQQNGGKVSVPNHIVCHCYGRLARYVNASCRPGDEVVGIGFMKTNNPDKGNYRTEFHIRQLQKPWTDEDDGFEFVKGEELEFDDLPDGSTIF